MSNPNDALAAACKPAMRAMTDAMIASLSGAARYHELSLKMITDSLSDAAKTAKELDAAKNAQEVLEIQAKLARVLLERTLKGWTRLMEAAGQNNADALRRGQEQLAQMGEDLRAMGGPGQEAPAALWKSFMDAASSAYTLGAGAGSKGESKASSRGS
jgi:phasin family protein